MIRVPTGAQDYYPAMYGGVSAIDFGPSGIKRTSLAVDVGDLDQRFVLAYTGAPRNSGINNWEVTKRHLDGDKSVHRNFERIVAIATAMREAVRKNDWDESRATDARRVVALAAEESSGHHSTPLIDRLVNGGQRGLRGIGARRRAVRAAEDASCSLSSAARRRGSRPRSVPQAEVLSATVARRGLRVREGHRPDHGRSRAVSLIQDKVSHAAAPVVSPLCALKNG